VRAPRDSGVTIDEALLAHLAPLGWEHIGLTGDYLWRQSKPVEQGRFRPLRKPAEPYVRYFPFREVTPGTSPAPRRRPPASGGHRWRSLPHPAVRGWRRGAAGCSSRRRSGRPGPRTRPRRGRAPAPPEPAANRKPWRRHGPSGGSRLPMADPALRRAAGRLYWPGMSPSNRGRRLGVSRHGGSGPGAINWVRGTLTPALMEVEP
jgi:hypothetical protein